MDSNRIEGFNALWALTKSFLYPILFMFVCILTRERERVDLASHISYLVSFVRFFFSPSDGSLSQTRKARIWSFHPEYLRRTVVIW